MSEQWTSDGIRALELKLVRSKAASDALDPTETQIVEPFSPEFVYPIFGEAQTIYGYEDLNIELHFASGSLAPYLNVSYSDKVPTSAAAPADDVEAKLYEFLPSDYMKNEESFKNRVDSDESSFKAVGDCIGTYYRRVAKKPTGKGKGKARIEDEEEDERIWEPCKGGDSGAIAYEAWATRLDSPSFRDLHRRMQIFISLYIEGGTFIEEEDTNWEVVVLYEKRPQPKDASKFAYHFVGYTTLYSFLHFPDKTRLRLSQFVILPPFQGASHGSQFYSILYKWILSRGDIADFGVEDPSEAFQDLRDKIDLALLLQQNLLEDQMLPLEKKWISEQRQKLKLNERQFARLIEMLFFVKLGKKAATRSKNYRLMVKERLYRFNYDRLKQLDPSERKEKLSQTFENVLDDYERLTESTPKLSNGR